MTAKILFIGLDAADRDLLRALAAGGEMPAFAGLLARSAQAETVNPAGFYVGAVWPSFYTGQNPARHGRFCHTQTVPGGYDTRQIEADDIGGEPFWRALDRAGRKCAVIDIPKTPHAPGFGGLLVANWAAHDPDAYGFFTWPESLADDILERYGGDPVGDCDRLVKTPVALARFRDALLRRIEVKTEFALDVLGREPWDLMALCFHEPHCVGHHCWHLHDPRHAVHLPDLVRALGDPVRDVYLALDAALARLLAAAGPETLVVVLADVGMGPQYDANRLLERALLRIEAKLPQGTGLRGWRPFGGAPPVAARKCFVAYNNAANPSVRVNLVGREASGRIRPGAEFDSFLDALERELRAIVNVDTGEPVFVELLRPARLYRGERLGWLPDLVGEWNRDAPIAGIESPTIGRIAGGPSTWRLGDHRDGGLVLMRGPGLAPGPLPGPISVMDFAPSFAARLGVALPGVDGLPIPALVDAARAPA